MASIRAVQSEIERLRECGSIAAIIKARLADLSDEQKSKVEELLGVSKEDLLLLLYNSDRLLTVRIRALEEALDKVDVEV